MANIQYIKAGEKRLPAFFGMRAFNELAKAMKMSFSDATNPEKYAQNVDLEVIAKAAKIALDDGSRKTGGKKRYDIDEVWDLIDDYPEDKVLEQITEMLTEAILPKEDFSPNSSPALQESTEK